jgi:SAM-dependent methyltransferase
MVVMLNHAKSILRKHPYTRDLYHLLTGLWTRSQIYFCEIVFGRYYTAARFDRRFAKTSDPWGYCGDPVSEERRGLILKSLPRNRYPRLLEVGCGAGWMTLPLASRTDDLLSVDISSIALARAREKCRQAANIRFVKLDLLTDPIMGTFDCIVCAGVLDYLPAVAQQKIRNCLVASLAAGGDLVLEHTRHAYPGRVAGSEIHALYRDHPELRMLQHDEVDTYAITLFRKVA